MKLMNLRTASRRYWFASGLIWGVPLGAGGVLVAQAFVLNISASIQHTQTQTIADGLTKTNLILQAMTSGPSAVVVERNGDQVTVAADATTARLVLSRTEQVLFAWTVESGNGHLVRDRQQLIDALAADNDAGRETISPMGVQQFLALAGRDESADRSRWIDDPTILSLLTQDLTRRFSSSLSREAELSLWPRVARCLMTFDSVCWDRTKRMGGSNEKGAGEPTPELFKPLAPNQTAGT